jgi:hypothetical protein
MRLEAKIAAIAAEVAERHERHKIRVSESLPEQALAVQLEDTRKVCSM